MDVKGAHCNFCWGLHLAMKLFHLSQKKMKYSFREGSLSPLQVDLSRSQLVLEGYRSLSITRGGRSRYNMDPLTLITTGIRSYQFYYVVSTPRQNHTTM